MCINATIIIRVKSGRAISELLIQLTVSNPVGLRGPRNTKLSLRT